MDDNLIRLKTLLAAGAPIPKDLAAWVLNGISAFEVGECKTLCRALGLRLPGQASLATRQKINARDSLLREIARQYDGSDWRRAAIIADRLKRFPYIGEEKPIYAALVGLDVRLPETAERIYAILSTK